MDFEKTYENMKPKIKTMINSIKYHPSYLDKEDLFQEVSLHLWNIWKKNGFDKNTVSYILQSSKFYLKNYLRCADDGLAKLSLDEELDDKKTTFKDIISDKSNEFSKLENKMFIGGLLYNGLTVREKQVLFILYQGFKSKERSYTTREIGSILGISHIRVIKIRENLKKKIENYLY